MHDLFIKINTINHYSNFFSQGGGVVQSNRIFDSFKTFFKVLKEGSLSNLSVFIGIVCNRRNRIIGMCTDIHKRPLQTDAKGQQYVNTDGGAMRMSSAQIISFIINVSYQSQMNNNKLNLMFCRIRLI